MFGDRLKELREDRHINQDTLGEFLGVTRSTISGYETNTIAPSLDIIIKIADYFGVSLDYLTCRTKEMYNINMLDDRDQSIVMDLIKSLQKHKR